MSKCFIIMPFSGQYDSKMLDRVLKPAATDAGYTPERGDDIFSSSYILADIWRSIQEAEVVIAVLARDNSNVYYELGLAHAIHKPVILVANRSHQMPSNLWGVRVIVYEEGDPDWGQGLKTAITNTLKVVSQDPNRAIPECFR